LSVFGEKYLFVTNKFLFLCEKFLLSSNKFLFLCNRFLLSSNRFLLSSNKFLLSSNKFLFLCNRFLLSSNRFPLSNNGFPLLSNGFLLPSNRFPFGYKKSLFLSCCVLSTPTWPPPIPLEFAKSVHRMMTQNFNSFLCLFQSGYIILFKSEPTPLSVIVQQQVKTLNILANLEKQSKPLLVFSGLILIGMIGLIDYLTGAALGFSVFYVLPISLVTWVTSRRLGIVASLISAIVWLVADTSAQFYPFPTIAFWNSLIRLAFFLIITFLLSALKSSLQLAHTDSLTSAVNPRYFHEIMQMEINRCQRNRRPFTIAYIDLDNFKAVNDEFGHLVGDQVLVTLVSTIAKVIRKSDSIARLGGDEFAVLFPETDPEAAHVIFSKIHGALAEVMQQRNWSITFSVGILTCVFVPNTTHELVEMVDKLMYEAKADGKNKVKYSIYNGE